MLCFVMPIHSLIHDRLRGRSGAPAACVRLWTVNSLYIHNILRT